MCDTFWSGKFQSFVMIRAAKLSLFYAIAILEPKKKPFIIYIIIAAHLYQWADECACMCVISNTQAAARGWQYSMTYSENSILRVFIYVGRRDTRENSTLLNLLWIWSWQRDKKHIFGTQLNEKKKQWRAKKSPIRGEKVEIAGIRVRAPIK